MSVRPDSAIARRMLRPIRPNPLIATRIVIEHRLLRPPRVPWNLNMGPRRRQRPGSFDPHDGSCRLVATILGKVAMARIAVEGIRRLNNRSLPSVNATKRREVRQVTS